MHMADVTVAQFADVLKVPVDRLLSQLEEAGIRVKGSEDTISDEAKLELLTFLGKVTAARRPVSRRARSR
jgi:translation initiation factor IF-2